MFSMSDINFANGVYGSSPAKLNGLEAFIMQSAENVDTVVKDFKRAIEAGYDPNSVIDEVLAHHRLTEKDFTSSDIKKLNRQVEEIYKAHKEYRGY